MQRYLQALSTLQLAVIGDVMLDCYLSGDVLRISPEAPVPVLRAGVERRVPGGAANVATNLASLGSHVALVGLVGDDATRRDLLECLEAYARIDCRHLVVAPERRTTRKLRVIGAQQQIVRIDDEDDHAPASGDEAALIAAATQAIAHADAVIISDYGKGGCPAELIRDVIAQAAAAGKRVVVDPKRRDLSAYKGATLLTPNRKELTEATGLRCETDDEAAAAARVAQRLCGADILLTRSDKGISFFPVAGSPLHLPTVAQAVFDVSGAGDTVVAVITALLSVGAPFEDAMRIANHAAGIVVSKVGTSTVTSDELARVLTAPPMSDYDEGLVLALEEAVALRAQWAEQKLTVGVANGCFDLLHPGHIALIKQAAATCDRLIVAINSDESVRRLKGASRPIQNETARATLLGAIRGVAAVVVFPEDTPLQLLQALQPDVLVKGSDYQAREIVGADVVEARGGRIVLAELVAGHSTTFLVESSRQLAERDG